MTNIKNKFRTGFTIIELLVVIVIIGILATITLVSYNGIQAKARDASVLSDLDTMDALQTNYGLKNGLAGKSYYSGSGSDTTLGFTPSSGNVIDVVISSTDYCIRGYNTKGTKNSINNSFTKESTLGICSTLNPSATAIANSPTSISVTGGTVTYSGGDTIRTFTSSGTLTVTGGTITGASVLVVAGGGGGGGSMYHGAGGGAGGVLFDGSHSLTAQSYPVTVGNGATALAAGSGLQGNNGSNSVFDTLTAIGGGGGGAYTLAGKNGGSGGGGSRSGTGPGAGVDGQGHAGGTGIDAAPNYGSGGGGGASYVGYNGTSIAGGNGGDGVSNSISGSAVYYGGGGGGGTYSGGTFGLGGLGGGGSQTATVGTNGTANTGGGGGAPSSHISAVSGAGGSGIVIVRYLTP